MSVKIESVTTKIVKRTIKGLKKPKEVRVVCIVLSNDGNKAETVEIDVNARGNTVKRTTLQIFATFCRQKKIKVGPKKDDGPIPMNGSKEVCCDVPGDIASDLELLGGDFLVTVGGKRDKDGDVEVGDLKTLPFPKTVKTESGSKIRYSQIVGVGAKDSDKLTFEGAYDFPPGWDVKFDRELPKGDYPGIITFEVESRPGADDGETARLVLKTMKETEEGLQVIEDNVLDFVVGSSSNEGSCCCKDPDESQEDDSE